MIKRKDLIIRRPENKCKPDMYWKLIGKRVKKKINLHDPINFKEIY